MSRAKNETTTGNEATPVEVDDSGVTIATVPATDWTKATLVKKLAAMHAAVSFLKKENQGYNFKFVSSSQALLAIRSVMDDVGVLLVPAVTQVAVRDHTTNKGGHEYFTEIHFTFTWLNVDDPAQTLVCNWYGQGLDEGEKGVGKAMTYAEKFFILKFFNIATDKEDPDYVSNQTPRQGSSDNRKPALQSKAKPEPKPAPKAANGGSNGNGSGTAPAKCITIVTADTVLGPIVRTFMETNNVTKPDMRKKLEKLWSDAKGDEGQYKLYVKATFHPDPPPDEPERNDDPDDDNVPF